LLTHTHHTRARLPGHGPQVSLEEWVTGPLVTGEGIYACKNNGSCVRPDTCACFDGYAGHDCGVPLCRYYPPGATQPRGCLNNGICGAKCV
jgi:hypothetical protein